MKLTFQIKKTIKYQWKTVKNSYFNPKHIFSVFNLKSFTNRSFAHLYLTVQKVPEEAHGKYCSRWSAPSRTLTECECCDALNKMFLRVCLFASPGNMCMHNIYSRSESYRLCRAWDSHLHCILRHLTFSCMHADSLPASAFVQQSLCFLFCFPPACNVLYINSVDMESLTGPQAIAKAISQTLATNPLPDATTVHFKVSTQGITLTDSQRKWVGTRNKLLSLSYLSHFSPVFYIQRLKQAASNKTNNVWTQWSVELSKMHEYKSNKWIKWHLQNLRLCL